MLSRRGVVVLAVVGLGAFLVAFGASMVTITLPVLQRELGVSAASAGWVPASYLALVTALLLAAGALADRVGTKRVFVSGALVFALGTLAAALAPSFAALLAARVVQGAGAAASMAAGPALLVEAFPPAERGRALGLQAMLTYVGLTLGPSAGGVLTAAFGWRFVFVALLAVSLAVAALAALALAPDGVRRKRPLDLASTLALGVASAALLVAVQRGAIARALDGVTAALGLTTLLAGGVLFARGRGAGAVPRAVLASADFRRGIGAAIAQYASTFALGFATPFLLQSGLGRSPREAGLWMTIQPATMVLASPLAGHLADKVAPRAVALAGLALLATGSGWLALSAAGPLALASGLALVGAGAGLFTTPNTALVLGAADPSSRASASATMAWARNVGMALGVASAAILFALGARGAADDGALARTAFHACAALAAGCALAGGVFLAGRFRAGS